jgi:hypothetical protein
MATAVSSKAIRIMNRRRSNVYALRLDLLYAALILILLPIRIWIDRGLDNETLPAVLAQPLFWFLCGVLSLAFGVVGLRIRCGLRLQLCFLLIAAVYFCLVLLLHYTGLPTPLLIIISALLGAVSVRFWHRNVSRILSHRAFRLPAASPTAGDIVDIYVRVSSSNSSKNRFAEHEAAR